MPGSVGSALLPEGLRAAIAAVVGPLTRVTLVGGSFGAQLLRVEAGGAAYALKWAQGGPPAAMVAAEAHGLAALAATQTVRVPAIAAAGDSPAFVLSEWVAGGARPTMELLGEQLAALHRHSAPGFGLERDNFIGGTPQPNGWLDSWPAFFRARRLLPQVALAAAAGLLTAARHGALERLAARLDDLLAIPGASSLIHGDLWGGNVVAGPGDAPP